MNSRFSSALSLAKHRLTGQCQPPRMSRRGIQRSRERLRLTTPRHTGNAVYVWTGDAPPWSADLGDFRCFTEDEIVARLECSSAARAEAVP